MYTNDHFTSELQRIQRMSKRAAQTHRKCARKCEDENLNSKHSWKVMSAVKTHFMFMKWFILYWIAFSARVSPSNVRKNSVWNSQKSQTKTNFRFSAKNIAAFSNAFEWHVWLLPMMPTRERNNKKCSHSISKLIGGQRYMHTDKFDLCL